MAHCNSEDVGDNMMAWQLIVLVLGPVVGIGLVLLSERFGSSNRARRRKVLGIAATGWSLVALITALLGLVAGAGLALAFGTFGMPGMNGPPPPTISPSPPPAVQFSVIPVNGLPRSILPGACTDLGNLEDGATWVGTSIVRVMLHPAAGTHIESVEITVDGQRSIPEMAYSKCSKVLPKSGGVPPKGQVVRLPTHGSVYVPTHGGNFFLKVQPPKGHRPTPTVYLWYVSVIFIVPSSEFVERHLYSEVFIATLTPSA